METDSTLAVGEQTVIPTVAEIQTNNLTLKLDRPLAIWQNHQASSYMQFRATLLAALRRGRSNDYQALIDSAWYLGTYSDVASKFANAEEHFSQHGWAEGRNPAPLFDTEWYFRQYPDVEVSGCNPLAHFVDCGWREMRSPHPLFDVPYYLEANKDVADAQINPLAHYIQFGWKEGRAPHPLFEPAWYKIQSSCPDGVNPLTHYVSSGAARLLNPTQLFDAKWYVSKHPEASDNPLAHYAEYGLKRKLSPHPLFDGRHYLDAYTDVANAEINPLVHYLLRGHLEARNPNANFDSSWYLSQHPEAKGKVPLIHFIETGQKHATRPESPRVTARPQKISGDKAPERTARNVLLVAHSVPRDGRLFGAERSFIDMVKSISGHHCNLHVLLPNGHPEYVNLIKPFCVRIYIASFPWWRSNNPPDQAAVEMMRWIIRDSESHMVYANTIMLREPLLAARAEKIPGAVHCRELISEDEHLSSVIGLPPDEIVRQITDHADIIVANSLAVASLYFKGRDGIVAPNVVDLSAFSPTERPTGSTVRVGIISSNIKKKGIGDFAEIAEICSGEPSLQFHIVGPETLIVSELKAKIADGRLRAKLHFDGYKPSPALAIAGIDVLLCLSSFAESFGRTVAEAMASEKLVVAYDKGAIPELVKAGVTGCLVPFGDKLEIARILNEYVSQPQKFDAIRKQARAFIAEKHAPSSLDRAIGQVLTKGGIVPPGNSTDVDENRAAATPISGRTKLRIAYFIWHFPVPSETFVLNELRALHEDGHELRVFCKQIPHPDFKPDFPIEFKRVASPDDLAAQLNAFEADIVHSHFVYPTVTDMVWPAAEKAKVPFTFIAHAQDIFRYENDARNRIQDVAHSQFCLKVFAPSRFHREYLIDRGVPREKISITPNSVDPGLFARARPKPQQRKSICTVARFVEKKGIEFLIQASPALKAQEIDIHIYGYGELEGRYKEIVAELEADNVYIHGPVDGRDNLIKTFEKHDLLICPSIRACDGDMDGVPTILMDAIAAGLPVMASEAAGIPDLVIDGVTGLVCEPTPHGISDSVTKFFELPAGFTRNMKRAALEHLIQNNNTRKIVRNMVRIWTNQSIGIVLVTWNNLPELKEVLKRLLHFTSFPAEISICDNNSNDDVKSFLKSVEKSDSRIRLYLNSENSMVGPGTNIALQNTSSEYVIYVCGKEGFALDFNWEQPFINSFDENPKAALAGTLCYSPSYLTGKDFPTGNAMFSHFRGREFSQKNPDREFFHVQGGLFAMRAKAIRDAGGFSKAVPHNGTDVELSYYLESLGWELASAQGMVSIYNKTRPPLEARVDETTRFVHPPRLVDLEWLDAIISRKLHLCPVCGWKGKQFDGKLGEETCPQCKCDGDSRTIWRYLSTETTFTYRRLPALGVGLSGEILKVWSQQFQGLTMELGGFAKFLSENGRLPNQSGKLNLILLKELSPLGEQEIDSILRECRRLLHPDKGTLLVVDEAVDESRMKHFNFALEQTKSYSSFACRFGWRQIFKFRLSGHRA